MQKISFSLNFLSGHFYGQSFIKTVPGPFSFLRSDNLISPLVKKTAPIDNIKILTMCNIDNVY